MLQKMLTMVIGVVLGCVVCGVYTKGWLKMTLPQDLERKYSPYIFRFYLAFGILIVVASYIYFLLEK